MSTNEKMSKEGVVACLVVLFLMVGAFVWFTISQLGFDKTVMWLFAIVGAMIAFSTFAAFAIRKDEETHGRARTKWYW